MSDELVTILTFNFPSEAYVIKARLESEGIRCHLQNENFYYKRFFSQSGVQLQVLSSDVERAKIILDENKSKIESANDLAHNDEEVMLPEIRRTSMIILIFIIIIIVVYILAGL
jgi:hypothetical protein